MGGARACGLDASPADLPRALLKKEVQDTLRASDDDGWVLVAGTAEGRVELVHTGGRAPPPSKPLVLASAMKWITAAVVLAVVDQGSLALSDAPQRWLGDNWGAGANDMRRNLTLMQLLSMTSGLRAVSGVPNLDCDWLSCGQAPDAFTAVDSLVPLECCVLAWASSDASSFGPGPPGAVFNYNSMNLIIAAAMAEHAANASFAQLFSGSVQRYLAAAARYIAAPPNAIDLLMSPLDYAAFMRAVLVPRERGGLLSESTRAAMFTPTRALMNSTLEAQTGAAGWQYGFGVWLEDAGEVASCLGYYGAYPRANLTSGAFAVLVPTPDLLHDVAALQRGLLMRRAVDVMGKIWTPLQRALAEAENKPAAAPLPAAAAAMDADGCADATETVADSDAVAVTKQAQRALFDRNSSACRDLLAAVRIHVTVHSSFSAFVLSKPTVMACGNGTAAVRAHVFVDTLLADVSPLPPHTSSAAFAAGAATSPRLWIKLKSAPDVAAATSLGTELLACASADGRDVAADQNAAIAAQSLDADVASRIVFVPDNNVGVVSAAGPAWLAAAAVELLRNDSHLLVRSPSLIMAAAAVGPKGAAGSTLLKVLSPAAMRGLAHLQQ